MSQRVPIFRSLALIALGILVGASASWVWTMRQAHLDRPYAGQDQRQISSLSAKDIAALEAGEGWGLAKPAELNGYPGPAHVLELASELDLDPAQKVAVTAEFEAMREAAKKLGAELIAAEAAVDDVFRGGTANRAALSQSLQTVGDVRARLRETHLAAHLAVSPLLTPDQTRQYAELRGYLNTHGAHDGH